MPCRGNLRKARQSCLPQRMIPCAFSFPVMIRRYSPRNPGGDALSLLRACSHRVCAGARTIQRHLRDPLRAGLRRPTTAIGRDDCSGIISLRCAVGTVPRMGAAAGTSASPGQHHGCFSTDASRDRRQRLLDHQFAAVSGMSRMSSAVPVRCLAVRLPGPRCRADH